MERPWFCSVLGSYKKERKGMHRHRRDAQCCMAAPRGSLSGGVGDSVGGGCSCGLQRACTALADSAQR